MRLSLARRHALKGSTAQGCDSDRHSEIGIPKWRKSARCRWRGSFSVETCVQN